MTLFFINRDVRLTQVELDDPHRLVMVSDVIVIVGKDDEWVTTQDRHDARGQVVQPRRRADLLAKYLTISKPTNFKHDDE